MNEVFEYMVVAVLIMGFAVSFIKEIQLTVRLQKMKGTLSQSYKRILIGHCVICIALISFIVSYLLNICVAMQIISSSIITSNSTSISCIVSLILLLIAKLVIVPQNNGQKKIVS